MRIHVSTDSVKCKIFLPSETFVLFASSSPVLFLLRWPLATWLRYCRGIVVRWPILGNNHAIPLSSINRPAQNGSWNGIAREITNEPAPRTGRSSWTLKRAARLELTSAFPRRLRISWNDLLHRNRLVHRSLCTENSCQCVSWREKWIFLSFVKLQDFVVFVDSTL